MPDRAPFKEAEEIVKWEFEHFPQLSCSRCGKTLPSQGHRPIACNQCHYKLEFVNGIFKALRPESETYFQNFISEYAAIRQAEGRGSVSSDFYLALPHRDLTGRFEEQWRIRSKSFHALEEKVIRRVAQDIGTGMDILDIGAGNGWLSYQLARHGHRPVALDVLVDERDGLGAAAHFFPALGRSFPRFQAEMDSLPFAAEQFDLVIFNASFHYSTDLQATLREALRCLRPQKHLVIVDSPIYHHEQSGLRMKEERHQQFFRHYGFRSDSIPSVEFLTYESIFELGQQLSIKWTVIRPNYGLWWFLRPLRAKFTGRREPAKFHVLWGRKASA